MKKKKLNILYVHNGNFDILGANKLQVLNMSNSFNFYSNKFKLLAFGSKNNFNFNFINLNSFNLNYYFRSIILYLNSFKLDFNHIYSRDLFFSFLKSFSKSQIIYELHEISDLFLWNFLFNITFKKLFKLVVISNGLKEELIVKGFNKKKIIVLPDGVNLENFKVKESQSLLKKNLNLPLNKKLIIYTGSFQNWKGYDTLLESSINFPKNSQLIMVGGSDKEVNNLSKKYPKVIFTGFVKNTQIPKYLKCSDILVIPNSGKYKISTHYTSPLKLFEYMASKKPIISSDLPSIREIVDDKDVLYFQADNPSDLSLKVETLLNDEFLSNSIAKNSYKKVKNYTWNKRVEKILQLYRK